MNVLRQCNVGDGGKGDNEGEVFFVMLGVCDIW